MEFICIVDNNIISKEELEKSGFVLTETGWVLEKNGFKLVYNQSINKSMFYYRNALCGQTGIPLNKNDRITIEKIMRVYFSFKGFYKLSV